MHLRHPESTCSARDDDARALILARRSLRASQERRAEARRSRRWLRGRRALLAVGGACALAAGGAVASPGTTTQHSAAATASGATGKADVAVAQRALGIDDDGILGPRTRRAIRRFQAANGLRVDGVLGPQTLRELGGSKGAAGGDASGTTGTGTAAGGAAVVADARPAADLPQPSASDAATLARIADCESGGDPAAISKDGRYRGKYQFDRDTWTRMGGSGDPAAATEAEQDARAAELLDAEGTAPWPVCG